MATLRVPTMFIQLVIILLAVISAEAGNVVKARQVPAAQAPSPPTPPPPPMAVPPPMPPMQPMPGTTGGDMDGRMDSKDRNPGRLKGDTQSASKEFLDGKLFQTASLTSINDLRRNHGALPVVWNTTLARYASSWSNRCRFKHSGSPFGEILSSGHDNVTTSVAAWAYQEEDFNFQNPEDQSRDTTGLSFSQLVWKGSQRVGCARTNCGGQGKIIGWLVVCEFEPKGNRKGEFAANVGHSDVPLMTPMGGNGNNKNKDGVLGKSSAVAVTKTPLSLLTVVAGIIVYCMI